MVMYLAGSADTADSSGVFFLAGGAMILAVVAYVVFFIAALISIVLSSRLTLGGKLLWLIAAFAFPFLGSLVWFVWGRGGRLSNY